MTFKIWTFTPVFIKNDIYAYTQYKWIDFKVIIGAHLPQNSSFWMPTSDIDNINFQKSKSYVVILKTGIRQFVSTYNDFGESELILMA